MKVLPFKEEFLQKAMAYLNIESSNRRNKFMIGSAAADNCQLWIINCYNLILVFYFVKRGMSGQLYGLWDVLGN